jgi:hypothetical protein
MLSLKAKDELAAALAFVGSLVGLIYDTRLSSKNGNMIAVKIYRVSLR